MNRLSLARWSHTVFILGLVLLLFSLISSSSNLLQYLVSLMAIAMAVLMDIRSTSSKFPKEEAIKVLSSLRNGNLKARATVGATDDAGRFLQLINEVAEELESLVSKNKLLERAKTQWLQELAHDLRTPLASLELAQTTLQNAKSKLTEEQQAGLITDSLNEVNHLRTLVEDLMTLSLMEDLSYFSQKEQLDLKNFFENILAGYSERAKTMDKEFVVNFDPNLSLVNVLLNKALLTRLVKNCLDNALAFSYTRIEFYAERGSHDGELVLKIKNDGPKMNDEQIKNYGLQRKSRGDSKSSKLPSSLGLGSIIIFRATKIMGAKFIIENQTLENSSPGVSFEFRFK